MSKITARRAKQEDVPVIADIIRKLGWFPHAEKESEIATRRRVLVHLELADSDESHTVLVAEDDDGQAVGYVSVHWLPYLVLSGPEGYISELFVREDARGRGVGSTLMEDVKELAVTKGCSRLMTLNNRTRPSYERDFYARLGFEEREEMANLVLQFEEE